MASVARDSALRAITIVALVVAAGAFVWPPSTDVREIPPFESEPDQARMAWPHAGGDPAAARSVVSSNIFSRARTAPRSRYDPKGSYAESSSDAADQGEGGVPGLFGIVIGPAGASALMRLDTKDSGPSIYRVGDRGGTYRVEQIDEASVVLNGPQGWVVVRLTIPQETAR